MKKNNYKEAGRANTDKIIPQNKIQATHKRASFMYNRNAYGYIIYIYIYNALLYVNIM